MKYKNVTLKEAIEREFLHALTQLQAHGWHVFHHEDHGPTLTSVNRTRWIFGHPTTNHYVEGRGRSYGEAVYMAQVAAKAGPPMPSQCAYCHRYMPLPKRGSDIVIRGACEECHLAYDVGCWWVLNCDEAHGHDSRCMVIDQRVKQPDRREAGLWPVFQQYIKKRYGKLEAVPDLLPIEHCQPIEETVHQVRR